MKPKFGAYATRSVPRYTSYPTAPHFSDDVGARDQAVWLSALDPADPVSLYVHVPFCRQVCWYCGCNMKLASRDQPIRDYARTLMREISVTAGYLPGRMMVSHLHWGGGTPTALLPDDLECAMEVVSAHFDFTLDAELAIESDPRTLTDPMIRRIGSLGFNRASFGVQEFDPKVQFAINRIQPPDMVRKSVDGLRAAGVSGINFDLIYGLPHQTVDTLSRTIDFCARMRPDRIALFGYAHVPWMAKKQRMIDEASLPGAAERIDQARMAAKSIVAAGYVPIGLDHFALPNDPLALAAAAGTLRRNFQGYTTDRADTLLGLGATSIGRTPHGYVQNVAETGAWARSVDEGVLPVAKGIALTEDDQIRSWVIEALMCQGSVDLAEAARHHGVPSDWWTDAEEDLQRLETDGLITFDGARMSVAADALHLVRVVAAAFDDYLPKQSARHSVAV
jgi:oxygen-independent coproporphyrinogen-3 oxidase